jgi:hypothetical protein
MPCPFRGATHKPPLPTPPPPQAAGLIWSGHADGFLRVWSLGAAAAAAAPLRVADRAVTAVAVDGGTGDVWVGSEDGEITVVRWAE